MGVSIPIITPYAFPKVKDVADAWPGAPSLRPAKP
jgi:hypothetical protein